MIDPKSLKTVIITCDSPECTETIEVRTVLYCLDIVPKFADIQTAKWRKIEGKNRHYCPKHRIHEM